MPVANVGEITATTISNRTKKLANNVENNNALLNQLKRQGNIRQEDGGDKIVQELDLFANTNAQSYDGYDTLATAAQQVLDYAEYAWKQYAVSVPISGKEQLQNSGEERMINLVTSKVTNAERSLRNKVDVGLHSDGTGNGGKDITGLQAAVPFSVATGTYGGINRANFSIWRPQIQDPASTPTSATLLGSMNLLWVALVRGTDKPNLILADNIMYTMFQGALQPNQRFMDAKTATAGFENLKYMTAPVVLDGGIGGNMPASTMYFLNTDYLFWVVHSRRNFAPLDPDNRAPVNQDAIMKYIGVMGNLTCSSQEMQGVFIGT